jgi:hypothetical protein
VSAFGFRSPRDLERAQLHAPDLARDRLRQLRELDAAHALVRRETLAQESQDRESRSRASGSNSAAAARRMPWDGAANRIGARYDRGFGDGTRARSTRSSISNGLMR